MYTALSTKISHESDRRESLQPNPQHLNIASVGDDVKKR